MGETEKPAERQFVVKTPGKFILTGEHAVVYGKLALASSVDLLTEIFLTLHTGRHPSPSIGVCFEDLQFNWSLPLSELPIANACTVPHLNIELMGQLKVLVANRVPPDTSEPVRMSLVALCFLYCTLIGSSSESFTIRVKSAIPIGAGLGSSAAFSVGSSAAFHLLRHVTLNKAKPFEPNLELINDWAFQCEKMFHATPSGIDNAVCTYGGVVKFKTVVIGSVAVPEARILLVNTGVSRQTKFLIESVRKKRNNFPLIVDPILESIDQISHQVADIVQHPVDGNFSSIQVSGSRVSDMISNFKENMRLID